MGSRQLIARNVREIRLLRKLSQEGLALEAEIDRAYVSKIERSRCNPTIEVLDKLAAALSVKTVRLFDEKSISPKPAQLPRGRRRKRLSKTKRPRAQKP
ncbi:helix-turn-helix domain-containing protein [Hyphococcus sp.]|jgi:transcriptional regulator with XRE-family HTH domain|uniref:helix-turn-helix domain-containing protein n=1 Tax=Hyphococcus sp. TaxID=2038636 RepID=UPI003D14B066